MSRLVFLLIGVFIIARMYILGGAEALLASTVAVAVLASMVWFTDFWTGTLMNFGWLESLAKDFKNPSASNPALVLLAWVLLLLYAGFVAFR